MTAPVNAAAIEAAKDAAMRFDLSLGRVKLAEAALTAALPFLRAEWETELRTQLEKRLANQQQHDDPWDRGYKQGLRDAIYDMRELTATTEPTT